MSSTRTFTYQKSNVTVISEQAIDPSTDGIVLASSEQDSSSDIAANVIVFNEYTLAGNISFPVHFFIQVSPASSSNDSWLTVRDYYAQSSAIDQHFITELNLISVMRWRVVVMLPPTSLATREITVKVLATVATGISVT